MEDATAGKGPGETISDSPLRAIGVAVGLGLLGPLVAIVLTLGLSAVLGAFQLPLLVALALLLVAGQWVAFGGTALGYLWNRRPDWSWIRSYLGIEIPSLRELGIVLGGWVVLFGMLIVISLIVQALGPETGQNQTAELAFENPSIVPMLIVAMFLVVGPSEEILYRGVVQGRLREALPAVPAIAIASGVFAVIHLMALTGGLNARLTTVAILFLPSLVFGAVYEYTGNLVVPILLHGLHNSVLLALLWVAATNGAEMQSLALPWFAAVPA